MSFGPVVLIALVVVSTSLFVPDTIFAFAAGVLFGLLWGTVIMALAGVITASVDFVLARRVLRGRIDRMLSSHPRLAAFSRAVARQHLGFHFLVRLAPMSPVAVSYLYGASGIRYPTFLLASLGLIPGLFVSVYFGDLARPEAEAS